MKIEQLQIIFNFKPPFIQFYKLKNMKISPFSIFSQNSKILLIKIFFSIFQSVVAKEIKVELSIETAIN